MRKRSRQKIVVQPVESAMPPLRCKLYTVAEVEEILGLGRHKVMVIPAEFMPQAIQPPIEILERSDSHAQAF